jgi:hypothetical protein
LIHFYLSAPVKRKFITGNLQNGLILFVFYSVYFHLFILLAIILSWHCFLSDELLQWFLVCYMAQASSDQRGRLMMTSERLNQSSERIRESQRTVFETEEIGVSILQDLHNQRQSLLHAHTTVCTLFFQIICIRDFAPSLELTCSLHLLVSLYLWIDHLWPYMLISNTNFREQTT